MKKKMVVFAALLLFWLNPLSVMAHDYWVIPASFNSAPGTILEVGFSEGHRYFENEGIPDITKFDMFVVTPGGDYFPLAYARVEPNAAWARVPMQNQGTYVIGAVSTMPEYWCQTTEGYKPGLKTEHPNAVKAGKYVKSVKTFITVGESSESFRKALGHEIEIMPQADPSVLKAGQTLPVSVLFRGEPLGDVPVFGVYEGFQPKDHSDYPVQTKTDKNGVASIKIDRAGKWIVFAKHEMPMAGGNGVDFANYRPYMMFEVK